MHIRESIKTELTLAVLLIDDFTGTVPHVKMRVYLQGLYIDGITNKSGYYLFLNLQDKLLENDNVITIESYDDYYQKRYFPFSKTDIATNGYVFKINLIPSISYPFSVNETLIRGTVLTEITLDGKTFLKPVPEAKVKIKARNLESITNSKGDYLFYFKDLRKEDVVSEDEKKFIKMGTSNIFDLSIICQGYKSLDLQECKAEMYRTTVIKTPPLEVA